MRKSLALFGCMSGTCAANKFPVGIFGVSKYLAGILTERQTCRISFGRFLLSISLFLCVNQQRSILFGFLHNLIVNISQSITNYVLKLDLFQ